MSELLRMGNEECALCGHVHPSGFDCQHEKQQEEVRFMAAIDRFGNGLQADGWTYCGGPTEGDCRKLVTLEQDGMVWIGIRAYDAQSRRWLNNSEPEPAVKVKAWRDLPEIARGFWDRGKLVIVPRQP